jgi:hypothetical protein
MTIVRPYIDPVYCLECKAMLRREYQLPWHSEGFPHARNWAWACDECRSKGAASRWYLCITCAPQHSVFHALRRDKYNTGFKSSMYYKP